MRARIAGSGAGRRFIVLGGRKRGQAAQTHPARPAEWLPTTARSARPTSNEGTLPERAGAHIIGDLDGFLWSFGTYGPSALLAATGCVRRETSAATIRLRRTSTSWTQTQHIAEPWTRGRRFAWFHGARSRRPLLGGYDVSSERRADGRERSGCRSSRVGHFV